MQPETQTVIIVCAILATVGFLVLVSALIPTLLQLRSLFADLQKTSAEMRSLAGTYGKIGSNVEDKLDKLDRTIDSAQRLTSNLGAAIKAGFAVISSIKGGEHDERQ